MAASVSQWLERERVDDLVEHVMGLLRRAVQQNHVEVGWCAYLTL